MQNKIDEIVQGSIQICEQLHTIYNDNSHIINQSTTRKQLYDALIADSLQLNILYEQHAKLMRNIIHDNKGAEDELISLLHANLTWLKLQHSQHVIEFITHIFEHITRNLMYMCASQE